MKRKELLLEVCANGLESAINAQRSGAHRIELCEQLEVGG
jgi:copper homeostasis protein